MPVIGLREGDLGVEFYSFFIPNALENSIRVVRLITMDEPATLAYFDDLVARAGKDKSPLGLAVVENLKLPPRVAAMFLAIVLLQWHRAKPLADFSLSIDALQLCVEEREGDADSDLVRLLLRAVYPLSGIAADTPPGDPLFGETADAFLLLARHLARNEDYRAALGCAESSAHARQAELHREKAAKAAALARSYARKCGDPELIGVTSAQHAHLYAQYAEAVPSEQARAYDALREALRFFTLHPDSPKGAAEITIRWTDKAQYSQLRPIAFAVSPPPQKPSSAEEVRILDIITKGARPIWNDGPETVGERLFNVMQWAIEIENQRLQLEPPHQDNQAVTSWTSFAFTHSRLKRAIPHSLSMAKEADRDNLLLLIAHETTHVFSLHGVVGWSAWALRFALVDLEMELLESHTASPDEFNIAEWVEFPAPAVLGNSNLETTMERAVELARAERELEVARKLQFFERVWSPWFEGLAVLGELDADPRDDTNSYSPVVSVVNNLFDVGIADVAEELGIGFDEAYSRRFAEAERMLGEAQQRQGRARLRGYLEGDSHTKYLAGYLAVRSVMAAWRETLGEPLCAAEAFEMLLHATRFTLDSMIPDPAAPFHQFKESVERRHLDWIRGLCSVPKEDLVSLMNNYSRKGEPTPSSSWKEGRVIFSEAGENDQRFRKEWIETIKQAKLSLTGTRADPKRVAAASKECQSDMAAIAAAMEGHSTDHLIEENMIDHLFGGLLALPIGAVEAPFWMNRPLRQLLFLVRTRELDPAHGRPGYNGMSIPLGEEDFEHLARIVESGGPAFLNVSRVAFLTSPAEDRPEGVHFLVLRCEDWMHISNAGLWFQATEIPSGLKTAIEQRFATDGWQSLINALCSEDHPCVRRTREWLNAMPWELAEYDLTPWARHTLALAGEILELSEAEDKTSISRALYQFVFGDSAVADTLVHKGISALSTAGAVGEFIQGLRNSGRLPGQNDEARWAAIQQQTEGCGIPCFERTGSGWDVVRPAHLRATPTQSK